MPPRRRRFGTAMVCLAVMVVVAAAVRKREPPVVTFRVTFGLHDREPSDWSGQVAVTGGEVAELTGWRFEGKDAVDGTNAWKCRTHDLIAPEQRYAVTPAKGKPRRPPLQPWPNGITIRVRGSAPEVRLTLAKGEVKFDAAKLLLGEPQTFLDAQVRVERLPTTRSVRPAAPDRAVHPVQDDYPAFWVRYKTGKHYLAWVAYQNTQDRVLLAERDGPNGEWSKPIEVAGPGDHFRVALASTHNDTLWVVWSSQRNHNWDLYGRPYRDGKLGDEVRLTDVAGPDIWHRMTTDRRGRAWVVWQGFRGGKGKGRAAVFARCADGDGWHETIRVSQDAGNDWDPVVAADAKEDRVWVGWDTYNRAKGGYYNIRIRSLSGGPAPKLGEVLIPEDAGLFNAHVSLACDREGRLWAAWDESGPQWGKDTGFLYANSPATRLYASRWVRVRCLIDGRWQEPGKDFQSILPPDMKEYNELPQLQPDGEGRMWLAFRHRTCRHPRVDGWAIQGSWDCYATAYLGDRWLAPVPLPQSGGRNDMRVSSQRDREGQVYFAYASDNRAWQPPAMKPRNLSIAVSQLGGAPAPGKAEFVAARADARQPLPEPVHPREAEQVARVRAHAIEAGAKKFHIYRGDLHRHTDISLDGVGDGSLMDLHRYALDAAAFDYILVTDHNMGHDDEYTWWRTQKANDLYTVPGSFISMYGYERSVPYPNGHRNVIWTERGHRTLPLPPPRKQAPARFAADTGRLYAYLRDTNGICTPHTPATDQGTNWKEHDDALEPLVEIFQGYHTSYEAAGAPKTEDARTDLVHGPYEPDGFVVKALDKGYRLGFQASSDHISTHVSYACIVAEEFSRKGLVKAMLRRHSYAATDNIVMDVRMGNLGIMGDVVRTAEPRLDVSVLGTGSIDRVEVVRNGEVVHTEQPAEAEARFRWEDPAPAKKRARPSYYYVRMIQKDGQMAWASPIWVDVGD